MYPPPLPGQQSGSNPTGLINPYIPPVPVYPPVTSAPIQQAQTNPAMQPNKVSPTVKQEIVISSDEEVNMREPANNRGRVIYGNDDKR